MTDRKQTHIIEAAHAVFLRYGYKRVTMCDIAEAAGISRPGVYLLFANKEEIFKAVIRNMNANKLAGIEKGIAHYSSVKSKLIFAFELWAVQPFEVIHHSPDAKELIYCAFEFASDVINESGIAFEALLVKILEGLGTDRKKMSPKKLAHLLRGAARGLKEIAVSGDDLRQLIKELIELTIR